MEEQLTIKEIARLCGVGVSTVSRAINNHPDINEETRKKVLETIRQVQYVPNNSARNLKRAESHTIAVLVKDISNPFFGSMIRTLEQEIAERRYSVSVQHVEEDEDELQAALQLEKEKRLRGILFLGGIECRPSADLQRMTVPYVACTVSLPIPEGPGNGACVSIDDEAESCRLTSRLLADGYRRIAILAAQENDESIGKFRLSGYLRAHAQAGVSPNYARIFHMEHDTCYSIRNGYRMAQRLLSSGVDFDCVYAISDTLAAGACRALRERGLRIPEDCGVAGFDGLELGEYYCPSITTVRQPMKEIAGAAVRLLFDLIRKRNPERKILFEGELIERESTRKMG